MFPYFNINFNNLFEVIKDIAIQIGEFSTELLNRTTKEYKKFLENEIENNFIDKRQNSNKLIETNHINKNTKEIFFNNWLVNAITFGCSPFDMKEGFKKSNKVKFSKEGNWYLRIPIKNNKKQQNIENDFTKNKIEELKNKIGINYKKMSDVNIVTEGEKSKLDSFIHPCFVGIDDSGYNEFDRAEKRLNEEKTLDDMIDEFINQIK